MIRNQAFEKLRVILMLMVIFHHCGIHGELISAERLDVSRWGMLIAAGGQVAVVTFYMLYGYFAIENKFKFVRIFRVWICTVEYCILAGILNFVETGDLSQIFVAIMPVSGHVYNFVSQYVILAMIFPFLRAKLCELSREQYLKFVILLFGIVELIPFFCGLTFISDSLILPLFFAIVGGWIKKYSNTIENIKIFRSGAILAGIVLLIIVIYYPTLYFKYIGTCSVATFIFAVFLILKTETKYIRNNWHRISKTVFGVFVWHDNPIFRYWLWGNIFKIIELTKTERSIVSIIVRTISASISIFALGMILEFFRLKINRIIDNTICKGKLQQKVLGKVDSFYED